MSPLTPLSITIWNGSELETMTDLWQMAQMDDDEDFLTTYCDCGRYKEWAMCEHDQDCPVYLTPKECHGER